MAHDRRFGEDANTTGVCHVRAASWRRSRSAASPGGEDHPGRRVAVAAASAERRPRLPRLLQALQRGPHAGWPRCRRLARLVGHELRPRGVCCPSSARHASARARARPARRRSRPCAVRRRRSSVSPAPCAADSDRGRRRPPAGRPAGRSTVTGAGAPAAPRRAVRDRRCRHARRPGSPRPVAPGVAARPRRRRRAPSRSLEACAPGRARAAGRPTGRGPSRLRTARSRSPSQRSTTAPSVVAQGDVVDVGVAVAAALGRAVPQPLRRERPRRRPGGSARSRRAAGWRRVRRPGCRASARRARRGRRAAACRAGSRRTSRRRLGGHDLGVDVSRRGRGGSGAAAGTGRPGTGRSP